MTADSFANNIDTLNHLNVVRWNLHNLEMKLELLQLTVSGKFFPHIHCLKKEQKVCLQAIWFWNVYWLVSARVLSSSCFPWVLKEKCGAKKILQLWVMLLGSIMKDKVEKLSNSGLKAFTIGTGDKEGFTPGCILSRLRRRSLGWVSKSLGILVHGCSLWREVA